MVVEVKVTDVKVVEVVVEAEVVVVVEVVGGIGGGGAGEREDVGDEEGEGDGGGVEVTMVVKLTTTGERVAMMIIVEGVTGVKVMVVYNGRRDSDETYDEDHTNDFYTKKWSQSR